MNIKELYQEIILEHGKNPRNLRKTDNFNKDAFIVYENEKEIGNWKIEIGIENWAPRRDAPTRGEKLIAPS